MITIHEIKTDGLPDPHGELDQRMAFIVDGAIVPGWWHGDPEELGSVRWVAASDIAGRFREFSGITHWVELNIPGPSVK
jgi:hypothetical protein